MELENLIESYDTNREKRQAGIFYSIFILTDRIRYVFDRINPEITFKQFILLIMLAITEKSSYTELGKLMGCSRQNVKNLAQALEKKGFIKIDIYKDDKRQVIMTVSEKAAKHFQAMDELYSRSLGDIFKGYSDEEIKELYNLIMKLYDGVESLEESWEY